MRNATLVGEGATDRLLLHPLRWLLATLGKQVPVGWADLSVAPRKPAGLKEKIAMAVNLYPCELLFVHRDADGPDPDPRYEEINTANASGITHVCVIPIRMQETWLLINEAALRSAAGCPRGTCALDLPRPADLERLADPKTHLRQQLRVASEATGRHLRRFNDLSALYRLADLIEDWSPLRGLAAFRRLEDDLKAVLP